MTTLEEAEGGPAAIGIAIDADDMVQTIGARIRQLRIERDLTLQVMSDRTGLSASMLSMVERGRTSPSIGTLVAIASALRVQMAELFDSGANGGDVSPVLPMERQPLFETAAGVVCRQALDDRVRGLSLSVNDYQPNTESSSLPIHHEGLEYGVVLEGSLVVEIEGVEHALNTGDAITYDSSRPHRISNRGESVARTVWVNLSY